MHCTKVHTCNLTDTGNIDSSGGGTAKEATPWSDCPFEYLDKSVDTFGTIFRYELSGYADKLFDELQEVENLLLVNFLKETTITKLYLYVSGVKSAVVILFMK
jgi:hypothetical protein